MRCENNYNINEKLFPSNHPYKTIPRIAPWMSNLARCISKFFNIRQKKIIPKKLISAS